MNACRALLYSPGGTSVSRRDDAAVGTDGPATLRLFGRKRDRVKMIFRRGGNLSPFLSAVAGRHYDAARAHDKRALPIENIKTIKRRHLTRWLIGPFEATVRRVEDYSVSADCPTVAPILSESHCADR